MEHNIQMRKTHLLLRYAEKIHLVLSRENYFDAYDTGRKTTVVKLARLCTLVVKLARLCTFPTPPVSLLSSLTFEGE
jgi:hypothetical protein